MSNATTAEELRWLAAVETGAFGIWDLDPRLDTVHYSPEWKTRLGIPRIHAADSTWFWRCRVHPEDLNPMLCALRSHLDGSAASYEARFRLRINGSGYRTMLSRGRVVARDEQGNATRMVGTMVDLAGRPLAAAQLGLAAEPAMLPASPVSRLPFHAALGTQAAAAAQTRQLIHRVDDLLEMALRQAGVAAGNPRQVDAPKPRQSAVRAVVTLAR